MEVEMGGIVIGFDGSEHAADALRFAIEEARLRDCPLLVVEVWQLDHIPDEINPEAEVLTDEAAQTREQQLLRDRIDKALDGLPAPKAMRTELRSGNPAEVLAQLGHSADLLVVGARGRGGFRHLLTGSVASQLVNHAPCPVTVVPGRPARIPRAQPPH
jgi:nucleotide-binding universal stress UspA family protein